MSIDLKNIKDADIAGKRVLVRADLDVPLVGGEVADDSRLKMLLPTIAFLRSYGAKEITLIGHLGRPEGRVVEGLRVAPVVKKLEVLLTSMQGIVVKENVRFDPREEANDDAFAHELANFGDIFVNESFASAHRAHASVVGVAKLLPSYAGLHFAEEVEKLSGALVPPKGAIAIVGGDKFETKIPLLEKLLGLYSKVFVGGALANDLLRARGWPIGSSVISKIPVPVALSGNDNLYVPDDAAFMGGAMSGRTSIVTDTRADEKIFDIGPRTGEEWAIEISESPFVLWNGPVGVYEQGFTSGTDTLAKAIVESKARAVIGGGDTLLAISKFGFDPARIFVSMGGGAMLEFLSQGTLPAIEVLKK